MMSVLIKGIEMPKSGYKIVYIHSNGYVYEPTNDNQIWNTIGKATSVPTPHGDLIDVDEELRLMQSCDYDTYDDYSRAFDMLDCAPTVIEAEGE